MSNLETTELHRIDVAILNCIEKREVHAMDIYYSLRMKEVISGAGGIPSIIKRMDALKRKGYIVKRSRYTVLELTNLGYSAIGE